MRSLSPSLHSKEVQMAEMGMPMLSLSLILDDFKRPQTSYIHVPLATPGAALATGHPSHFAETNFHGLGDSPHSYRHQLREPRPPARSLPLPNAFKHNDTSRGPPGPQTAKTAPVLKRIN